MKTKVNDTIKTLVDVQGDFSDAVIPAGASGTVVECYTYPQEGYAVDLSIPNEDLVGGVAYEHVTLKPDDFIVIDPD